MALQCSRNADSCPTAVVPSRQQADDQGNDRHIDGGGELSDDRQVWDDCDTCEEHAVLHRQ